MRTPLAALVLVLAAPLFVGAQAPPPLLLIGDAFNAEGRLAYRVASGGAETGGVRQVTAYLDEHGREFGRMHADYSTYPYSPVYRMADDRHHTIAAVTRNGDLVRVERTVRGVTTTKTLRHRGDRPLIVGPGLNEFVKAHWDRLLSGEDIVCDFVIPSRQQIVTFRVGRVAGASIATNHRFSVKADNFFLRLLAPEVHVEYDRSTRGLQVYEGPSNVNDATDRPQTVVIRFPVRVATPTTPGGIF